MLKFDLYPAEDGLGGTDGRAFSITRLVFVTDVLNGVGARNSGRLTSLQNGLFRPASLQNDEFRFLPDPFHL